MTPVVKKRFVFIVISLSFKRIFIDVKQQKSQTRFLCREIILLQNNVSTKATIWVLYSKNLPALRVKKCPGERYISAIKTTMRHVICHPGIV